MTSANSAVELPRVTDLYPVASSGAAALALIRLVFRYNRIGDRHRQVAVFIE